MLLWDVRRWCPALFLGMLVAKGMALTATIMALIPTPLAASPWSMGTVADRTTGMSILYKQSPSQGIHLTSHFFENNVFSLEANWQNFHTPSYDWRWFNYKLYSGAGLKGEARKDEEDQEVYSLVLPLGIQWNPQSLPLEIFAEAGVVMGTLPATSIVGRARGGLRATF